MGQRKDPDCDICVWEGRRVTPKTIENILNRALRDVEPVPDLKILVPGSGTFANKIPENPDL